MVYHVACVFGDIGCVLGSQGDGIGGGQELEWKGVDVCICVDFQEVLF